MANVLSIQTPTEAYQVKQDAAFRAALLAAGMNHAQAYNRKPRRGPSFGVSLAIEYRLLPVPSVSVGRLRALGRGSELYPKSRRHICGGWAASEKAST